MATLHLNKRYETTVPVPAVPALPVSTSDKADSQIDVELRVHGKRFLFRFDIPDAQGAVSVTDIDRHHMLTRVMEALDGKFGKIRLRAEL